MLPTPSFKMTGERLLQDVKYSHDVPPIGRPPRYGIRETGIVKLRVITQGVIDACIHSSKCIPTIRTIRAV